MRKPESAGGLPPAATGVLLSAIAATALVLLLAAETLAEPQPRAPELAFPGDAAAEPATGSVFGNTTIVRPAVCVDADGNFVVAWVSKNPSGVFPPPGDVFFQRIDSTGVPIAGRVQVNTSVRGMGVDVACNSDGSFAVVWSSYYSAPPDDPGDVYARRFDADGVPLGPEFIVNTTTAGEQHTPATCADAAGNFLVAWLSSASTADFDLVVRRFDSAGAPLSGEIVARAIEIARAPNERSVSVACDPSGSFILAWLEWRNSSGNWDVWARRFDSTAIPIAPEFMVSDVAFYETPNEDVDVALSASGAFAFSWTGFLGYVRQYDDSGTPVSGQQYLPRNDAGKLCVGSPTVAIDGNGRIVVVSGCRAADGQPDRAGVLAWQLDENGSTLAPPMRVNTSLYKNQRFPSAAIAPDGDFLVVWIDDNPQPAVLGAQFFCDPADAGCDICPGHDDTADADNDGVPDGCDACTNADEVSSPPQAAKLSLKRLETPDDTFGTSTSRASLHLAADFTTASPTAFAEFDPLVTGARVLVLAADGGEVLDVRLPGVAYVPGGIGWRSNRTRTKWSYQDKTVDPLRGIVKVVITDRARAAGPGKARAVVRGKRSIYPAIPGSDPPMGFAIVLGDDDAAVAGSCGERTFAASQCRNNLDHPAILCRR